MHIFKKYYLMTFHFQLQDYFEIFKGYLEQAEIQMNFQEVPT